MSRPSSGFARPPDPTTRWKIFAAPLGGNKYHPPGSYPRWPGARTQTEVTRFLSHAPRLVESNLSRHTSQVRTACPDYPVSGFFPSPGLLSPATQSYAALAFKCLGISATARCSGVRLPGACLMHAFARMRRHPKREKRVGLRRGCVRRLVPKTSANKNLRFYAARVNHGKFAARGSACDLPRRATNAHLAAAARTNSVVDWAGIRCLDAHRFLRTSVARKHGTSAARTSIHSLGTMMCPNCRT